MKSGAIVAAVEEAVAGPQRTTCRLVHQGQLTMIAVYAPLASSEFCPGKIPRADACVAQGAAA